jgi:hypothetical protein
MKTYGGAEVQFHNFLTWALDGGEWSASCPCHFAPRGKKHPLHFRQRVGWAPSVGLETVETKLVLMQALLWTHRAVSCCSCLASACFLRGRMANLWRAAELSSRAATSAPRSRSESSRSRLQQQQNKSALVSKTILKNAVFWDVTPCSCYKNSRGSFKSCKA